MPNCNIFPSRKSKAEEIVFTSSEHHVNIQFLRSVDKWSAGQEREASIYNAYLDAIKDARHFIYIENQFFVSSQEGFWRKVQNRIQSALVERIVRAHEAGEKFHVMVMTPLKPEFPGDWDSSDCNGDALAVCNFLEPKPPSTMERIPYLRSLKRKTSPKTLQRTISLCTVYENMI